MKHSLALKKCSVFWNTAYFGFPDNGCPTCIIQGKALGTVQNIPDSMGPLQQWKVDFMMACHY